MKPIVNAETNLGKKTRTPKETKIPPVDEIVEMTNRMPLIALADLSKKLNAEVERRVKEIKEMLNIVEST